jgi:hypothetical protein
MLMGEELEFKTAFLPDFCQNSPKKIGFQTKIFGSMVSYGFFILLFIP